LYARTPDVEEVDQAGLSCPRSLFNHYIQMTSAFLHSLFLYDLY
jgi:hypothetical protein